VAETDEVLKPRRGDTPVHREDGAGDTVVVACKLPFGLELHLDRMVEQTRLANQTAITEKVAVREDETYTLNGSGLNHAALTAGIMPEHTIIGGSGGYALTIGIPKAFWERWLEQNKNSDLVRNGLIFAASNHSRALDESKERAVDVRSGLEPLKPMRDDTDTPDPRVARVGLRGVRGYAEGSA